MTSSVSQKFRFQKITTDPPEHTVEGQLRSFLGQIPRILQVSSFPLAILGEKLLKS